MNITVKMLIKNDYPEHLLDIFQSEWPENCETTLENLLRAVELGLDLNWFAQNFLSDSAFVDYIKNTASAFAKNLKATAPFLKRYILNAACPSQEKYMKAITPLTMEYMRDVAPILAQMMMDNGSIGEELETIK